MLPFQPRCHACCWATGADSRASRTDAESKGRHHNADVVGAVKNAKAGQVQYRADKAGIVQCTIGRASFSPEQLQENLTALMDALNKSKPASAKGVYLRKVSVSSTMGPGVRVDVASTGRARTAVIRHLIPAIAGQDFGLPRQNRGGLSKTVGTGRFNRMVQAGLRRRSSKVLPKS